MIQYSNYAHCVPKVMTVTVCELVDAFGFYWYTGRMRFGVRVVIDAHAFEFLIGTF